MRILLATLGLIAGLQTQAATINDVTQTAAQTIAQSLMGDVETMGFVFKVGDQANYSLNMGSMIKGSMVLGVKDVQSDAVTITQDMDLGFLGKQNCEMVINPNTGETKSFVCNGQQQKPGDKDDVTMVDSKEDTITVPAGKFICLWIKAHSKSQNADIQQWVSPKNVPILGLVKTIAPSQMGQVVMELTSFKKN